ncbi:MAG TPA: DUF371 domain-containing protein [Candidatus Bathyarchaeia archaeon]|nr:DUF371 domain-containing protein [Candidatus Bathyarchaeia archaeon]
MHLTETKEVVSGYGHENIRATHRTTLEFTKEKHLSKKGDCIIAVAADKALADLSCEFKANLRKPNAKLTILIEAGGIAEQVHACGSQQLFLSHPTDAVIRKSDYVCGRTLAVRADKAANNLSREFVEKLRNPKQKVKITLTVRF